MSVVTADDPPPAIATLSFILLPISLLLLLMINFSDRDWAIEEEEQDDDKEDDDRDAYCDEYDDMILLLLRILLLLSDVVKDATFDVGKYKIRGLNDDPLIRLALLLLTVVQQFLLKGKYVRNVRFPLGRERWNRVFIHAIFEFGNSTMGRRTRIAGGGEN